MSGRKQILPPQPHVEDEMDTTEYQVERFGAQSPWQPTQLPGLLEHRDPPATTTTTSTDSNPDTVIGSTSIQFRPPIGTYKGKSPQRTQTTTPSITTSMQQQLARLQAEKEAALAQVKRLQSQQSASTSFLQRTAADVQNTATSASNQTNQLATHVDTQLDEIKALILGAQTSAQKDFQRIHANIDYLYTRGREWNNAYERRFASIEERLGQLELRPLMPQPERPQVQVEQLEAIAGQYLGAPPPPSPPQHQIYNAEPSPSPRRRRQNNDDDMIAGKAPPPSKFNGNRERLEGWLLQLTDYFTITGIRNERQKLAFVGLCMEGKALDWWKANKNKYSTWSEVQTGIELYYGDHYRADRAHLEIHELRQTGPVQDYLNEIDRLNTYAKIPDRAMINIIITKLSGPLRRSMAHYEHLRDNPDEWRKQLVRMDIITTEFQRRDKHPRQDDNKDRSKKRTFEDRIQLQGKSEKKDRPQYNSEGDRVPHEVKEKRKKDGRCFKCGMSNHKFEACPNKWRANTPPFKNEIGKEPAHKKARTDKGHLRITELGSEEDSGNE